MGRVYPFSAHDNQAALQDTITVFDDVSNMPTTKKTKTSLLLLSNQH
jgi:hypothetical protein